MKPEEAIELLKSGRVEELSLDDDLGDDERGTGYDVVTWVEEAVATRGFRPPRMKVHSANPSAREKMEAGICAIERLAERNRTPDVLCHLHEFLTHALLGDLADATKKRGYRPAHVLLARAIAGSHVVSYLLEPHVQS